MRAKGIVFTLLFIGFAKADTNPITAWLNLLDSQTSGNLVRQNQSFCYVDDKGEIQGYNSEKSLGLASVSKILTTLWALKKLNLNHTFPTKLYIKDKKVHIQGGKDPIFSRRSIYNMINKLNDLGINKIESLTYDDNFYFVPQAIDNSSHAQVFDGPNGVHYCRPYAPRKQTYKDLLLSYLNTPNWSNKSIRVSKSQEDSTGIKCLNAPIRSIRSDYNRKRQVFTNFDANPNLVVQKVENSSKNPFIKNGKISSGVKVLNLKSLKLIEILKYMNTVSSNLPADLIFHILGGAKKFRSEMSAILSSIGYKSEKLFISGSGIPLKTYSSGTWKRTVNEMSCQSVLKILELLLRKVNGNKIPIFDKFDQPIQTLGDKITKPYLAVSGVEGTVKNRFQSQFARNFVAKTGTLYDSTTLAGTLNTTKGKKHFVFLNTYPVNSLSPQHIQISRNIQNASVKKLFEFEGEKVNFQYTSNSQLSSRRFQTFVQDSEVQEF